MDDKKIRFDLPIKSGCSIGGILLKSNIYEYDFKNNHIEEKDFFIDGCETKIVYYIDNLLEVVASRDGEVVAIACYEGYQGKYEDRIFPGQTFQEIKSLTDNQILKNGSVLINHDYGVTLDLPIPFDEFDDINVIPDDFKMKSIRVADFSFWKTPIKPKKKRSIKKVRR